jgi:DMSO/TMAO reductase YedYZ molybdopterin-dependent catalytic subunit
VKWLKSSGKEPPKSPVVKKVEEDHRKHGGRLPPGQVVTEKWPVLHYGSVPRIDLATWRFRIWGLVEEPVSFNWDEFNALPRTTIKNDIHCVTHWSRFDNEWEGVLARDLLSRVKVRSEASHVLVHAFDGGFTTNLPLAILLRPDTIFAFKHDGQSLTAEHGWPCRLVAPPDHYFWKSAKWVSGLELLDRDRAGFWEDNGYHMNGNPWLEERYGS